MQQQLRVEQGKAADLKTEMNDQERENDADKQQLWDALGRAQQERDHARAAAASGMPLSAAQSGISTPFESAPPPPAPFQNESIFGKAPQMFNISDTPAQAAPGAFSKEAYSCLLYTSPSPRDGLLPRMPSSA